MAHKSLILSLTSLLLIGCAAASEIPTDGLILDLDADKGIALEEEDRVVVWTNQVASARAKHFARRDEGRKNPGSGRPTLKRSGFGHNTVVFRRQELVNGDEDAFDHLTAGSGHTWFFVMSVAPQVSGLKDVNSFFGNLRNGGKYEGFWAGFTDDNRLWAGSRNAVTFGRWDKNNPQLLGPTLEEGRLYVVAGRMGAGTGTVTLELFVNSTRPVDFQ